MVSTVQVLALPKAQMKEGTLISAVVILVFRKGKLNGSIVNHIYRKEAPRNKCRSCPGYLKECLC